MTIAETGIATEEELLECPGVPDRDRIKKGAVAVIECLQSIPCDPCKDACPSRAIEFRGGIISLPHLDAARCVGCGLCIPVCPGQAIFVVNGQAGTVSVPYEFMPVPRVGSVVDCLDRSGERVTSGKVLKVDTSERNDRTTVVTVAVGEEACYAVRAIRKVDTDEV